MDENYTRIPNDLFDAFYRIKMDDETRRIFLFIARKTYGWNKKQARLSLSYFSESIGIASPHICRGIKKLIKLKMISGSSVGTSNIKTYSINNKFLTWEVVPRLGLPTKKHKGVPNQAINSASDGTTPSASLGTIYPLQLVPNQAPIKEIILKKEEKESIKESGISSFSSFDKNLETMLIDSKKRIRANAARFKL